jgi:hypothetical protein
MYWKTPLSGNVNITGPNIASNNLPFDKETTFRFIRSAAATGSFTITFNGVTIAAGQKMEHGVTASGTMTCFGVESGVP